MLEKEVKILDIDIKDLVEKLEKLGAERTFEWEIHDVYYDFPNWENLKMEENKRMFRVRKKGEEHIYTIKRTRTEMWKKEWAMIKDEHETRISNVESFQKVLEKYGLTRTREKIKHRVSYKLAWAEFDIDTYKWIPPFLEIEEQSRDAINFWISKLWLDNHSILIGGSRSIFRHYWIKYLDFNWQAESKEKKKKKSKKKK